MSAAASGFELPYVILPPNSDDINSIFVGARLLQKTRICGSSKEIFSEWYIKSIDGDVICVAPLKSVASGCNGQGQILKISRSRLQKDFEIRKGRAC